MEKVTDYIGNFVYENAKLSFILTDEGRLVPDSSGFAYEYFIKDHLGNTRLTVKDSSGTATVMSEAHYYPFGLEINTLAFTSPQQKIANRYLYNGKELQDDFGLGWYDYGARFYDAQLGMWHSIDPLSEMFFDLSPYGYVYNDPIGKTDIFGMFPYNQNNENENFKEGVKFDKIASTLVDSKGEIIDVIDDGDPGIYMLNVDKDTLTWWHYYNGYKLNKKDGKLIGYTPTPTWYLGWIGTNINTNLQAIDRIKLFIKETGHTRLLYYEFSSKGFLSPNEYVKLNLFLKRKGINLSFWTGINQFLNFGTKNKNNSTFSGGIGLHSRFTNVPHAGLFDLMDFISWLKENPNKEVTVPIPDFLIKKIKEKTNK